MGEFDIDRQPNAGSGESRETVDDDFDSEARLCRSYCRGW